MDNTSALAKQMARTAVVILLIYGMLMGLIRVRNDSVINSAITLVDETGRFSHNDIVKTFLLNDTHEVTLNITINYNRVDNKTQASINLFKWNDTRYSTWHEALNGWYNEGDAPLEAIPTHGSVDVTEHITVLDFTLTEGSWTIQVLPLCDSQYSIKLVTVP